MDLGQPQIIAGFKKYIIIWGILSEVCRRNKTLTYWKSFGKYLFQFFSVTVCATFGGKTPGVLETPPAWGPRTNAIPTPSLPTVQAQPWPVLLLQDMLKYSKWLI